MTVNEYSRVNGISKQSVYDRLKRGTLQYKVIEGVKHIIHDNVDLTSQDKVETTFKDTCSRDLEKALKKLNKSRQVVKLLKQEAKFNERLVNSMQNEIDTLKKSLGAFDRLVNSKMMQIEMKSNEIETIEIVETKEKKKKPKKKK
jgi:hypothetical protein